MNDPSFELATGVLRVSDVSSSGGQTADQFPASVPIIYETVVPEGWDIFGNTNGGTLLAPVARAACDAAGRPDPIAVSAHYLMPGRSGPATITLTPTHETRRFSTFHATLSNANGPMLTAVVTAGDLESHSGPFYLERTPPDIPGPDECVTVGSRDGGPSFSDHVTMSIYAPDADFWNPNAVPTGRLRGWIRLPSDQIPDGFGLIQAIDAFPPAAFNTGVEMAYSPTLQLSTHMRGRPVGHNLLVDTASRSIAGGFSEIEETVWDEAGNLVAQGRQLCVVRTAQA
ncbi:MAG: thioesterase family protein [Acidimicrobiia bacterium]|nr:thioesterase family protein [Acidimicrobiia bacterium]MBP8180497.1 thioesterase family protein [Acidimicrobiia bacterium]